MTLASARIVALEFQALDLALREPFGIASGVQAVAANVLVAVRLNDGTLGYGEAAPLPAYNGETQAGTLEFLGRARPFVEGASAREWRGIARRLASAIPESGAARCGLELAILDALTKQAKLPLHAFFGGAENSLETDVTITTGTVAQAAAAATRWLAKGFRKFKVKVGGSELANDVSRVEAVHAAAPHARILLDANASLSAAAAIELLRNLERRAISIELFEQPTAVGDWDALAEVARHVSVAADESVVSAADALRATRLGPPHVINIKIMKAGIAEALEVLAVAKAAGMRLMIGGNVESMLAMTGSACLAGGIGGFLHVDLDTPFFFAESAFRGGFSAVGPRLMLPTETPGHGVEPVELAD